MAGEKKQDAAVEEKAAEEKESAEKDTADKIAVEKASAQKETAEKDAAEKEAAEKEATEKEAAEKEAASEKAAAEKASAEKEAAEKAAADKAATEKAAAEKEAADKATTEKAAEKESSDKVATEKAEEKIAVEEVDGKALPDAQLPSKGPAEAEATDVSKNDDQVVEVISESQRVVSEVVSEQKESQRVEKEQAKATTVDGRIIDIEPSPERQQKARSDEVIEDDAVEDDDDLSMIASRPGRALRAQANARSSLIAKRKDQQVEGEPPQKEAKLDPHAPNALGRHDSADRSGDCASSNATADVVKVDDSTSKAEHTILSEFRNEVAAAQAKDIEKQSAERDTNSKRQRPDPEEDEKMGAVSATGAPTSGEDAKKERKEDNAAEEATKTNPSVLEQVEDDVAKATCENDVRDGSSAVLTASSQEKPETVFEVRAPSRPVPETRDASIEAVSADDTRKECSPGGVSQPIRSVEEDQEKHTQDLHSLTVNVLKEKLKAEGLKVSGSKAELVARLTEHAKGQKSLALPQSTPQATPENLSVFEKPRPPPMVAPLAPPEEPQMSASASSQPASGARPKAAPVAPPEEPQVSASASSQPAIGARPKAVPSPLEEPLVPSSSSKAPAGLGGARPKVSAPLPSPEEAGARPKVASMVATPAALEEAGARPKASTGVPVKLDTSVAMADNVDSEGKKRSIEDVHRNEEPPRSQDKDDAGSRASSPNGGNGGRSSRRSRERSLGNSRDPSLEGGGNSEHGSREASASRSGSEADWGSDSESGSDYCEDDQDDNAVQDSTDNAHGEDQNKKVVEPKMPRLSGGNAISLSQQARGTDGAGVVVGTGGASSSKRPAPDEGEGLPHSGGADEDSSRPGVQLTARKRPRKAHLVPGAGAHSGRRGDRPRRRKKDEDRRHRPGTAIAHHGQHSHSGRREHRPPDGNAPRLRSRSAAEARSGSRRFPQEQSPRTSYGKGGSGSHADPEPEAYDRSGQHRRGRAPLLRVSSGEDRRRGGVAAPPGPMLRSRTRSATRSGWRRP